MPRSWGIHSTLEAQRGRLPKRQFGLLALIQANVTASGAWINVWVNCFLSQIQGGPPNALASLLVAGLLGLVLNHCMADMASRYTNNGGQFFWVAKCAHTSVRRELSYFTGWITMFYWQALVAATAYTAAGVVMTLVGELSGQPQPEWTVSVLTVAFGALAIAINIGGGLHVARSQYVVALVTYAGFGFVVIANAVGIARNGPPASSVFQNPRIFTGWNPVAAFGLAEVAAGAFLGLTADVAAHMAQDTQNAYKTVPTAIMWGYAVSVSMGITTFLLSCFSIRDVERQVVNSPSAFPFVGIWQELTETRWMTITIAAIVVFLSFATSCIGVAAGSREIKAFAEHNGLPGSKFFVLMRGPSPWFAQMSMLVLISLFAGLAALGAPAISSTFGLATCLAYSSYFLSLGSMLSRRLASREPMEPSHCASWTSRRWGNRLHICLLLTSWIHCIWLITFALFPLFADWTVQDLNWAVAGYPTVLVIIALAFCFHGNTHFEVPGKGDLIVDEGFELAHDAGPVRSRSKEKTPRPEDAIQEANAIELWAVDDKDRAGIVNRTVQRAGR